MSPDEISNITEDVMPGFAYNSQGHIMLVNDNQINHGFHHNRNIVQSGTHADYAGNFTRAATMQQMDFQKESASLAKDNPIDRIQQDTQ